MNLPVFEYGQTARYADQSLKTAARATEAAQHCTVLWFAEILHRRLFRELGYSSMYQYAEVELGFSRTRTGDYVRLARRLDDLPVLKASVTSGEIGYTKAREIVKVASPRTEEDWVAEAQRSNRRELANKVQRARRKAKNRSQPELLPASSGKDLALEVPVRVGLQMTAEQHARWVALGERLGKQGRAPGDQVEALLAGLDALARTLDDPNEYIAMGSADRAPRGAFQVHVHRCPECERTTTPAGHPLARADAARTRCDAQVSRPGERNRSTIPPRTKRAVLARDRHRCRAPGCHSIRFLEVHHIVSRAKGGTNDPQNLLTLCAACHRLWHERSLPGSAAAAVAL